MQKNTGDDKRGKGNRLSPAQRAEILRLKSQKSKRKISTQLGIPFRTVERWYDRDGIYELPRGNNRKGTGMFPPQADYAFVEVARLLQCSLQELSEIALRVMPMLHDVKDGLGGKRTLHRVSFHRKVKGHLSPSRKAGWPEGAVAIHAVGIEWQKLDTAVKRRSNRTKKTELQKSVLVAVADRHRFYTEWDLLPGDAGQEELLKALKSLLKKMALQEKKNQVWLVTGETTAGLSPTIGLPAELIQHALGPDFDVHLEEASSSKGALKMEGTYSSIEALKECLESIHNRTWQSDGKKSEVRKKRGAGGQKKPKRLDTGGAKSAKVASPDNPQH